MLSRSICMLLCEVCVRFNNFFRTFTRRKVISSNCLLFNNFNYCYYSPKRQVRIAYEICYIERMKNVKLQCEILTKRYY